MNYEKLDSILQYVEEIHYITDCEVFFKDNNIDISKFKDNKFILFEYTLGNWSHVTRLLNESNVDYSIHTDEMEMDYIII